MSTVYISSDYGKLSKKGDCLEYHHKDGTVVQIFPYKTKQIIIIGKLDITSEAMKNLMRFKINVTFLNKNGRFDGRLIFQDGKNVFFRHKQYQKLDNAEFVLNFSKIIVLAKLKNQYAFMRRIAREREIEDEQVANTFISMLDNINNLEESESLAQVRGHEGAGAKLYFSIFKFNIKPEWAKFNGRSKNPPKDNVNAVLSFIYTLLSYRIESAIESEGLDCYVGYLHGLNYGRKSLTFDLIEEFRTPIADSLTASIFNLGVLEETDFKKIEFDQENDEYPLEPNDRLSTSIEVTEKENKRGVLLTKKGINKVITQYERKLSSKVYYEPLNKRLAYKDIIFEQIKLFKRVINGEEVNYRPLIMK